MAQKQSDTGADEKSESLVAIEHHATLETSPPYFTAEVIRKPFENGEFGTVSYKVAVSGGTPEEGIRMMRQLTMALEIEYCDTQRTNYPLAARR